MKRKLETRTACLMTAGFGAFLLGFVQPAVAANKARVELLPSVTAVVGGEPFEVGLRFTLSDKWHIYWENAGDSGLPPKVQWKLPAGFEVGGLRFPIPKRKVQAGIVTNILEGKPVLLATVTPPKDLGPGREITIGADLTWLVCSAQCLMEKQSVSMSLPTVGSSESVKAAHEAVFKVARRKLPVSAAQAKHVAVTPSLGKGMLAPGSRFEVHLEVAIKRGFHIQSDQPLLPGLVAAEVFMGPVAGLFYDAPEFPTAKTRTVPNLGKLSEFSGSIKIVVSGEAATELPGDSREVGGLFVYQACNEKGVCFAKQGVSWSMSVPVGQAGAGQPVRIPAVGGDPAQDRSDAAGAPGDETGGAAGQTRNANRDTSTDADSALAGTAEAGDQGGGIGGVLGRLGLGGLLIACFLYGLLINATPCVLPLLSIKVLGFVQQAHESRRRTLALGLSFGVGVVLFFVLLGFLAAAGKNVLQYPAAVIGLGAVVLALALSMLGVYTLQVPTAATKLDASIQKEGVLSSFGKGALAPVLGFACTGPFLAGAFGWAVKQPPQIAVLAFLSSGLGMASPYVLLGANPNWLSFLPKPGNWMITFERIMGFLLLAMVLWLLHPLISHLGPEGLEWTLGFLVAVGVGCWLLGKVNMSMSTPQRWRYRLGAGGIVVVTGVGIFGWIYPLGKAQAAQHDVRTVGADDWSSSIPWRPVFPQTIEEVVRSGKTVFLNVTSAYCTNCKVNKAVAINTAEARAKMQELGVVPFQADFTSSDPRVFELLQKYDRPGPPLDVIYPAGKPEQPIVMETLFPLSKLLEKLEAAGPSSDVLASLPSSSER